MWVGPLALCPGLAVSQAGLVAFVGLVAPHVVRRLARYPRTARSAGGAGIGSCGSRRHRAGRARAGGSGAGRKRRRAGFRGRKKVSAGNARLLK